jgi:hypothetical protein
VFDRLEVAFLALFGVEIAILLVAQGFSFFSSKWNL